MTRALPRRPGGVLASAATTGSMHDAVLPAPVSVLLAIIHSTAIA